MPPFVHGFRQFPVTYWELKNSQYSNIKKLQSAKYDGLISFSHSTYVMKGVCNFLCDNLMGSAVSSPILL